MTAQRKINEQALDDGGSPAGSSKLLRVAFLRREKWVQRRQLCRGKIRELDAEIEQLRYQIAIDRTQPVQERVRIASNGVDWGIYWRDAPLSCVGLQHVKGIGRTRRESLIKSFQVVGKIETYRIVNGFSSIPGFSNILCHRLERRVVAWLSRFAPDYRPPASADHLPAVRTKPDKTENILWLYE